MKMSKLNGVSLRSLSQAYIIGLMIKTLFL